MARAMGVTMGAGRVVGLLLVVLLMMPGAQAKCGEREYSHEGLCCVFCEAGTFVADHCSASHLRGKCDPCMEGKDFTAHANGLEECLPCKQCKEGQITLRPCTLTQDAECQCKHGYFCADEGCEMCQRNSQISVEKESGLDKARCCPGNVDTAYVTIHFRHPDGKEIAPNSTDATDPGLPNQGREALVWVIPLIVVVLLGLGLLIVIVKKLKSNKVSSTDKDAEGGWIPGQMCSCVRCDARSCDSYKVQETSQIIVKDLTECERPLMSL